MREFGYSLLISIALGCLSLAALAFAASQPRIRLAAAVAGAAVCCICAFLSRNPRLFCLWGLGFSIPFLFAKTIGSALNKGGGEVAFNIDVTDVFLAVLTLFLAYDIFSGRRPGLRIPKSAFLWIAIMGFGLFTVVTGPYRTTAAHEVFRMAKMLLFFVVLIHELESPRRIMHLCGAITLGLIVNAITGLLQFHYHRSFGLLDLGEPSEEVTRTLAATSVHGVQVWRVGAFLLHPNVFGAFLAAVLPIVAACFLLRAGRGHRLYFLLAFVLGTAALLATDSRSGWVSFLASLSCFAFASISHLGMRRRSIAATLVLGVLVLGIAFAAREQIANRIFQSKAEALSFREVFKDDAKRMIAEHPLWGFGLNSYVFVLPNFARFDYGSWPPPVHHIYYLWWAETGLIGLGLHLAMWGSFLWIGLRNFRVKDERMFAINAACVAGMVAFALDGFVSFSLRITPTLKTFWLLAAVIMAVHYYRRRNEFLASRRALEPAL